MREGTETGGVDSESVSDKGADDNIIVTGSLVFPVELHGDVLKEIGDVVSTASVEKILKDANKREEETGATPSQAGTQASGTEVLTAPSSDNEPRTQGPMDEVVDVLSSDVGDILGKAEGVLSGVKGEELRVDGVKIREAMSGHRLASGVLVAVVVGRNSDTVAEAGFESGAEAAEQLDQMDAVGVH
jgi:hypothetical protein